jgi:hypothetical protein
MTISMRAARRAALPVALAIGAALAGACDRQEKAGRTPNPDSTAVAPQPVVVTNAGPISSVPAANLGGTVPPGPPVHDGVVACHVAVDNALDGKREMTMTNAGNVEIRECDAVVYAYGKGGKQLARMVVAPLGGKGPAALPPRQSVRAALPLPPAIATSNDAMFEPVVTRVVFADGTVWDQPQRAPLLRPIGADLTPKALGSAPAP